MKHIYILLIAISISGFSFAQSGNHQIIAGVELGLPVGDFYGYKAGFGFIGKALFGFSDHSQIGFTTGYTAFKAKGSTDDYKVKTCMRTTDKYVIEFINKNDIKGCQSHIFII